MQQASHRTSKEELLLGALGLIGITGFVVAFTFALNHASVDVSPRATAVITPAEPTTTGQANR